MHPSRTQCPSNSRKARPFPTRRQTGVSQRVHVGFLRSRPAPTPHRISLRLAARLLRLPLKGGVIALGARASRPHPVPVAVAELQCDAAGSHPVGGNSIRQAEGESWRRFRLIQVGRWPRLCQAWCGRDARAPRKPSSCGRDARAPGKPSSHDIVTPRAPNCRSILVPRVVEGSPSVFASLRVYSCLFVSIGGSSSVTIGCFSSNDPHGRAGAG